MNCNKIIILKMTLMSLQEFMNSKLQKKRQQKTYIVLILHSDHT